MSFSIDKWNTYCDLNRQIEQIKLTAIAIQSKANNLHNKNINSIRPFGETLEDALQEIKKLFEHGIDCVDKLKEVLN